MIGTLINAVAIVIGSLVGLFLRKGIKEEMSKSIMQGLGLCVMIIGLQGAIATENILLMIVSVALGGFIGNTLNIDKQMQKLGSYAQRKLSRGENNNNNFAQGFVTASLVFCIGAMAVVGALDSGIRNDHSTLIVKSLLDGIAAIVFASTFGIGVMLSAIPVLIYQGSIALLGVVIAPYLSEVLIKEISAIGGLLILAIGLNMALDKDIKVANFLPSILIPFAYYAILQLHN